MSLRSKLIRLAYQCPELRGDILPLVTRTASNKTYLKRLEERNFEVSPDEYTEHRNYLRAITPIVRDLDNHYLKVQFGSSRFTEAERKVLVEAVRILKASQIPISVLKKTKDDDPIIF